MDRYVARMGRWESVQNIGWKAWREDVDVEGRTDGLIMSKGQDNVSERRPLTGLLFIPQVI
jgi:hypothetical protein